MDVNNLSILFIRDYRPEYFNVSSTAYLNYHPFVELNKPIYKTIHLAKKDALCYIKMKNTEQFVYEKGGKFSFRYLQRDKTGFQDYEPPQPFYLDYLEEPTFILYNHVGVGIQAFNYLIYGERDGKIYMKWTRDSNNATVFKYDDYETNDWTEKLTSNIPAAISFTTENKLKEEDYDQ